MSDHHFKFTPIDRLNNFNRYVKFDKFNKIDKSDKFDKVDILENLKDMLSFTVLNKRNYCIIGWDKNTGKYEKIDHLCLYIRFYLFFLANFEPLFHIFLYPFLKRGLPHLNQ